MRRYWHGLGVNWDLKKRRESGRGERGWVGRLLLGERVGRLRESGRWRMMLEGTPVSGHGRTKRMITVMIMIIESELGQRQG